MSGATDRPSPVGGCTTRLGRFVKVSWPLGKRGAMHGRVKIGASFVWMTLLGALFPAAASAATPIAAGGSDFVTALVIAGAGALVIMLIMVVVPAARRGGGSPASNAATVTPFRAYPIQTS